MVDTASFKNQSKLAEFMKQRTDTAGGGKMSRRAIDKALYGEGLFGDALGGAKGGALAAKFTLPPLTVLNAREGYWQDRKRAWLALGIQSELGRGAELTAGGEGFIGKEATDLRGGLTHRTTFDGYRAKKTVENILAKLPEPTATVPKITVTRSPPKPPQTPEPVAAPQAPPAPRAATQSRPEPPEQAVPGVTVISRNPPMVRVETANGYTVDAYGKPADFKAPKGRFSVPKVSVTAAQGKPRAERVAYVGPMAEHRAKLDAAGNDPLPPTEWTLTKAAIAMDVESTENFFLVRFKNLTTGQYTGFELSERSDLDVEAMKKILKECIVTFNGDHYDKFMVAAALAGRDPAALHRMGQEIIDGVAKPWEIEEKYNIIVPHLNHVDLAGPNPSVRTSLKLLHARLHGRVVMDMPFKPGQRLTPRAMNEATVYCDNDLDATHGLFTALKEPLMLRVALGKVYGLDLRSKSDAQMGEAIVKKVIEDRTGNFIRRRRKDGGDDGYMFPYEVPSFVSFNTPKLTALVDQLSKTQFYVDGFGSVDTPSSLKNHKITIGESTYSMGIGGLHSNEAHRAVLSDDDNVLIDMDVASQYPSIIMKLNKWPSGAGVHFVDVYTNIVKERLEAKAEQQKCEREIKELEAQLATMGDGDE